MTDSRGDAKSDSKSTPETKESSLINFDNLSKLWVVIASQIVQEQYAISYEKIHRNFKVFLLNINQLDQEPLPESVRLAKFMLLEGLELLTKQLPVEFEAFPGVNFRKLLAELIADIKQSGKLLKKIIADEADDNPRYLVETFENNLTLSKNPYLGAVLRIIAKYDDDPIHARKCLIQAVETHFADEISTDHIKTLIDLGSNYAADDAEEEKAEEMFDRAENMMLEMGVPPKDLLNKLFRGKIILYEKLAVLDYINNLNDSSINLYKEANEYFKRLLPNVNDYDIARNTMHVLKLADLYLQQSNFEEAFEICIKKLATLNLEDHHDDFINISNMLFQIIDRVRNEATIFFGKEQYSNAYDLQNLALRYYAELEHLTGFFLYHKQYLELYEDICWTCLHAGDWENARKNYQAGLELANMLLESTYKEETPERTEIRELQLEFEQELRHLENGVTQRSYHQALQNKKAAEALQKSGTFAPATETKTETNVSKTKIQNESPKSPKNT